MKKRWILLAALLAACKPSTETELKAIIGAVLIDGEGGPPVSRSVVIVAGSRIRAIGEQASTPVPAGSDKFDGAGKFLVPRPVEIPGDMTLPSISKLEEARTQVDSGAGALAGMIMDTEDLPPALLGQWRNLRVVFFPRLHLLEKDPRMLAVAQRNTKKLAAAGVLIGAGAGPAMQREWDLLVTAGLSPMEVIQSSTRNTAIAIKKTMDLGTLTPGKRADLLLLSANPLEDVRSLGRVDMSWTAGK